MPAGPPQSVPLLENGIIVVTVRQETRRRVRLSRVRAPSGREQAGERLAPKNPSMIVTSSEFKTTVASPDRLPRDGFPQIAFMGRSNVGKSSLINRLLGTRRLAKTSKTPGRTRALQFYLVNRRLYFVDLPGYGYAAVPRPMREEWRGLVEGYLGGPERPDLAIVLVDARRAPTPLDRELVDWLASEDLPFRVVLTKIDKLPKARRSEATGVAAGILGCDEGRAPIATSAFAGDGLGAVWRAIDEACAVSRRPHPAPPQRAGRASHAAAPEGPADPPVTQSRRA